MFLTELSRASWPDQLVRQSLIQVEKYISLCMLFLCYLYYSYLWCVSGLIYKCLKSRTLDLNSNLGKPSQAKPSAWEARQGVPSQRNWEEILDQSSFGKRPGWTHSQQHLRRHSHSSYTQPSNDWRPLTLFLMAKVIYDLDFLKIALKVLK